MRLSSVLPMSRNLIVGVGIVSALAGCTTSDDQSMSTTLAIDSSVGSSANLNSLTDAINRDPQNAVNYNVRGSAFGQAGRYQEALADFNTAIQLNSGFYQAYNNRALIYRQLNQPQAALSDYNQAIQLNPSYSPAFLGRGTLYRQSKQYDFAMADFDQAIATNNADAKAYYNRALAHEGLEDAKSAYLDYRKAQELAPDWTAPAEQLTRFTVSRR